MKYFAQTFFGGDHPDSRDIDGIFSRFTPAASRFGQSRDADHFPLPQIGSAFDGDLIVHRRRQRKVIFKSNARLLDVSVPSRAGLAGGSGKVLLALIHDDTSNTKKSGKTRVQVNMAGNLGMSLNVGFASEGEKREQGSSSPGCDPSCRRMALASSRSSAGARPVVYAQRVERTSPLLWRGVRTSLVRKLEVCRRNTRLPSAWSYVGNLIAIISIGTFIGMIWMVHEAESCSEALINAALVVIAGILLICFVFILYEDLGI